MKYNKHIASFNSSDYPELKKNRHYFLKISCTEAFPFCRFKLMYHVLNGQATLFWQALKHCHPVDGKGQAYGYTHRIVDNERSRIIAPGAQKANIMDKDSLQAIL